ncbi:hypothetical protein GLOIN_2v683182 [Rhizophagus irregularis DAOM 181602=DAOM 197198]|uniref:Uncharacterized protein n=1 Tax=Rhizophagus irregularis (strain DAOM 181602 / DAOM 197198 / MUCL 43194) TaxID=747089 RepID=A0A2P4P898_RHIID|nr:hypothetical protein GLOIN_2v683182 [Rhizophagus irregularis DAOM 181602=DAOM 197198]POG61610.1 hypothetical protein GLOIN_2v683182 [Rhizophagus irregularis DAOM 181602=DAOM 197198]|eukprot:XP_025168476.1 hypothetical protein GLOIN_2v683182 [Rhizophagus irregularis DAOM 181602=DAOM 197198]
MTIINNRKTYCLIKFLCMKVHYCIFLYQLYPNYVVLQFSVFWFFAIGEYIVESE